MKEGDETIGNLKRVTRTLRLETGLNMMEVDTRPTIHIHSTKVSEYFKFTHN